MPDIEFLSLFTGLGGLDAGFEAAGFRAHLGFDTDEDAVTTNYLNGRRVLKCDARDIPGDRSLGGLIRGRRNAPRLLVGGPPCQPFSKAGRWKSGKTAGFRDPRADTIRQYFRLVGSALPDVWLLENVEGLKSPGALDNVLSLVEEVNRQSGARYSPRWSVLDASHFGVPQKRRRFFMVASIDGREFEFPTPTHAEQPNVGRLPQATAWDAIGNLDSPDDPSLKPVGKWADLLPSIPEGENYLWHTSRRGGMPLFGWRTRYWTFLLKLAKVLPSWTLSANPGPSTGPFHWENRLLSTEELARLQTLPRNMQYHGDRRSIQRQIGNAVPSLLAEVLARHIGLQYFGKTYDEPPKLSMKRRHHVPGPHPVVEVPSK